MGKMHKREEFLASLESAVKDVRWAAEHVADEEVVLVLRALDLALKAVGDPKKQDELKKALFVLEMSGETGPDAGQIFEHIIDRNTKKFNSN